MALGTPDFGDILQPRAVLVDGAPMGDGLVEVGPDEEVTLRAAFAPQESADFLVVTPVVPVHQADGTVVEVYLPEANLGMMDITDEDVSAIARR